MFLGFGGGASHGPGLEGASLGGGGDGEWRRGAGRQHLGTQQMIHYHSTLLIFKQLGEIC